MDYKKMNEQKQLQHQFHDICKAIDYFRREEKVLSHPEIYEELLQRKAEIMEELNNLW